METVLFLTNEDIKYSEECQHFIGGKDMTVASPSFIPKMK
jgi:hypothetical protein